MKTIGKALIWVTLAATLIFGLNFLLGGNQITFLQRQTYNGITFYTIDVKTYINNITTMFTEIPKNFEFSLPKREFNNDLVNNLKVIVNWLIALANFFVWIFKIPLIVVKIILGLFGFTLTNTYQTYVNGALVTYQNKWWLYIFVDSILNYNLAYL